MRAVHVVKLHESEGNLSLLKHQKSVFWQLAKSTKKCLKIALTNQYSAMGIWAQNLKKTKKFTDMVKKQSTPVQNKDCSKGF